MISYNKIFKKEKEYPLDKYKKKAAEYNGNKKLINATIGDPEDESFHLVYEELKKQAQNLKKSSYPLSAGNPEYLASILNWAKREYNFVGDKDNVCSSNGSKEAIFHFPLLFDWSKKQKVFFAELSYPVYKMSCEIYNIPFKMLPMTEDFLIDIDNISEEDWHSCQIFWINSPHNPTSQILPKNFLEKLLKKALKYKFIIASDECYNDIFYDKKPSSLLEFNSDYWLVFRSLSKRNNMTGFRTGAIISQNKILIQRFKTLRSPIGVGTPEFIQNSAVIAWNDDKFIKKSRTIYKLKRDILYQALIKKKFQIYGAKGAFYLWFKHPHYSGEELFNKFIEQGILVTIGSAFGKKYKDYIRLIYCLEMKNCQELTKRILKLKL